MFEIQRVKTSLFFVPACLEDGVSCYLPVNWFNHCCLIYGGFILRKQ